MVPRKAPTWWHLHPARSPGPLPQALHPLLNPGSFPGPAPAPPPFLLYPPRPSPAPPFPWPWAPWGLAEAELLDTGQAAGRRVSAAQGEAPQPRAPAARSRPPPEQPFPGRYFGPSVSCRGRGRAARLVIFAHNGSTMYGNY